MLPYYMDVGNMVKGMINNLLELKSNYNVIVLAGEAVLDDPSIVQVPILMPLVTGKKAILPVTSLFDEIYTTTFKEGDFDSKDHCATFFTLSTATDLTTGTQIFSKTRNITNLKYLKDNKMPADFRLILEKEIGYVPKKLRNKPVAEDISKS